MKVIRLSTFLDFGGIESKMANLSTAHNSQIDWVFCAIGKGGVASEAIKKNGKRVVLFGLAYRIPSFVTIYKLFRFFKTEKPDVVHTSGAEANFHGVIAARLAKVPTIIAEEIGIPNHGFSARKVFKGIFRLADYVLGESTAVCSHLHELYNIPSRKLKVVPNFVVFSEKDDFHKQEPNTPGIFTMVSVSRLEPVKNIESVLRVVARLVSENCQIQYTIVGEGKHRNALEKMVTSLKIENNVTFTGFQSNPRHFLVQSDLYLLTSFTEGFSNSLAEALYSGTPSLSTKTGAAEEIITNDVTGWLVGVDDDNALFETIKKIAVMDPQSRRKVGDAGRKTIIERYSMERHIEMLNALYLKKE